MSAVAWASDRRQDLICVHKHRKCSPVDAQFSTGNAYIVEANARHEASGV